MGNPAPPLGALPPKDSPWQVGTRSDKTCIDATVEFLKGKEITLETIKQAITHYSEEGFKFMRWEIISNDDLDQKAFDFINGKEITYDNVAEMINIVLHK